MATKIFAEELKKGDVIIIPASSQSNQKIILVTSEPYLTPTMVGGFGSRIKDGINHEKESPFQFGRKVDLDIERSI